VFFERINILSLTQCSVILFAGAIFFFPYYSSAIDYYEPGDFSSKPFSFATEAYGGIKITVDTNTYHIKSRFSRPGGGNEYLGSWDSSWTANVTQLDPTHYLITAGNSYYSLERAITVLPNAVEVNDTITNLRGEIIGIKIANEIVNCSKSASTISGQYYATNSISSPDRPFIHAVIGSTSVGMIARDDVYRQHSVCYGTSAGAFGIKDDNLALLANESYTVKWELYPCQSIDYYEFINTVRSAWQTTSRTLTGLYGFAWLDTYSYQDNYWRKGCIYKGKNLEDMNVAQMRDWLAASQVRNLGFVTECDDRWLEAFGTDYFNRATTFKQRINAVVERLRQADPTLDISLYFHMGAQPIDVPEAADFFNDRVMLYDGTQRMYVNPIGYYYGTTQNNFGSMINSVFSDMISNFDGIFWDEFNFSASPWYMYNVPDWDGRSVNLNSSNNVSELITNLGLITDGLRTQLINQILLNGKSLWTNFQPVSELETVYNFPSLIEYPDDYSRGHLCSGMAYGGAAATSNADILSEAYGYLQNGLLFGVSRGLFADLNEASILGSFFPITPREIYPGCIIGYERIITSRSGAFGFGTAGELEAVIFDINGNMKCYSGETVTHNNKKYRVLELLSGEIAVVVPGYFEPEAMTLFTDGFEGSLLRWDITSTGLSEDVIIQDSYSSQGCKSAKIHSNQGTVVMKSANIQASDVFFLQTSVLITNPGIDGYSIDYTPFVNSLLFDLLYADSSSPDGSGFNKGVRLELVFDSPVSYKANLLHSGNAQDSWVTDTIAQGIPVNSWDRWTVGVDMSFESFCTYTVYLNGNILVTRPVMPFAWGDGPKVINGVAVTASDLNEYTDWYIDDVKCYFYDPILTETTNRKGDISGPDSEPDGRVDFYDLAQLVNDWLYSTELGQDFHHADLTQDMAVNLADFAIMCENWDAKEPADPSLVAYWKFDDLTGSETAFDSAGTYSGTVVSAEFTGPGGGYDGQGGALHFNSVNSRVVIPASAAADIDRYITVSWWHKGDDSNPNRNYILAVYGNPTGWNFFTQCPDTIYGNQFVWQAGADLISASLPDAVPGDGIENEYKNRWNNWVCTKNADTGIMNVYLNGSLWYSVSGRTQPINGHLATNFVIGDHPYGGVSYAGLLDEVRVYNRELSFQEVVQLYNRN
jgi:hypothetical protein